MFPADLDTCYYVSGEELMEGGGEVAEKMGFKYQWTMSPWTSGCIGVGCIVSTSYQKQGLVTIVA